MTNKEKYNTFCEQTYIPIYSKPWWLDAICGEDNWDVWLYEKDGKIYAAMPYSLEKRGEYLYITKLPLTQNNGIIFNYDLGLKNASIARITEHIVNAACEFIKSLGVDVYEQQYQTTFTNALPFMWNNYDVITRYTYVISAEELKNLDAVWNNIDSKRKWTINKGNKCKILEGLDENAFFSEVEKLFNKEGLSAPFSSELWHNLYTATRNQNCEEIIYSLTDNGEIGACLFVVWDEKRMYLLIEGGSVHTQNLETKSALIWYAIKKCAKLGLDFDFEGSVIKRISKAMRQYGATPMPYYRIRKVFNERIILDEAHSKIQKLQEELSN